MIELPELEQRGVSLVPRLRTVRGSARSDPELASPVPERLAIGGPWTRPLTPQGLADGELEPDAQRFLEHESLAAEFFLVQLTCTFRPLDDEPFAKAVLAVTLSGSSPDTPPPIAWSMQPDRLTRPASLSRTLKLSASLKIMGVGLSGEAGQTRDRPDDEIFLEALYEGLSTPAWELTSTSSGAISGLHRFVLVVRSVKAAHVVGRATLGATISKRRFGFIPYEAALGDDAAPLEFRLS